MCALERERGRDTLRARGREKERRCIKARWPLRRFTVDLSQEQSMMAPELLSCSLLLLLLATPLLASPFFLDLGDIDMSGVDLSGVDQPVVDPTGTEMTDSEQVDKTLLRIFSHKEPASRV